MIQIDMGMPKGCADCCFKSDCDACEGYDDFCILVPDRTYPRDSDGYHIYPKERPEWCPLMEVES